MSSVGSIGRGDGDRTLTVDDTTLPVWGLDPFEDSSGDLCLSALIAVSEHTGHTSLPEVGEVVDCETSDGEEFRGEVVSLGLEGQGGVALNVRLIEGAENWEGRTMISLPLSVGVYLLLVAVVYLFTRDAITAGVLPLVAYLFAFLASRIAELVEAIAL